MDCHIPRRIVLRIGKLVKKKALSASRWQGFRLEARPRVELG